MMNLRLKLLGGFKLRDGADAEVVVRSRKLQGLIAYLALYPGQHHGREKLAHLLWDDRFEVQARQSLRQALNALKKLVGGQASDLLDIDDETMSFRPAAILVDAIEFERLIREDAFEDAAGIYGGDLLKGLDIRSEPFDAWLAEERARRRNLACQAWGAVFEQRLRESGADVAIEAGRRLVAVDPLRETSQRLLMRTYARFGRRSEALQQYQALADMLRRELDVAPDPETAKLYEKIRHSDGTTETPLEYVQGDPDFVAQERVQRRLAVILAADVVDYDRLVGADGEGTLAQLKTLRDKEFNPKIDEYDGRIVKETGDGVLIEFSSAVDAVQFAMDVQQAMGQHNETASEGRRIEFRMGINLGDVIVDGEDIYGDGVNIAAGLGAFAEPGNICVSTMVREGLRGKLDITFTDLGDQSLENITEPVGIFSIAPVSERSDGEQAGMSNATLRRPALAVLPFENLSGDREQEYFADGLTEDIITALSSWRYFPVIARYSTYAYKGTTIDIRQLGKELGARYVIEGSVQKSSNRVRVTAQLINAETGHHIWAERFDRDLQDIFELQDEISGKIAAVVSPELIKAESERSATKRADNLDAWDYCQRGKYLMNDISKSGVKAARDLFEHAVELDPNFVDAWCGIAHTCHRELVPGFSNNPNEAKVKLLDAARRAVALDDSSSAAHYHLCFAYMHHRRLAEAIAEGERAVDLNPIDPGAYDRLGATLVIAGRPQEAAACLETSLSLNPRNPRVQFCRTHLARAHLDAHQYEDAADQARLTVQRVRVYLDEHLILASALGHLGRADEARAVLNDLEGFNDLPLSEIVLCPWWQLYPDSGPNEHLLDGLRKAGLPE